MRFNQVGLILGMRATGKTLFVLGSKHSAKPEDKLLNIRGLIETQAENGFKVLIVDTIDHPSYRKISEIKPTQIHKFNQGIARAYMAPEKILMLVDYICRSPHFNNTFIVFEDAGKYTEKNLPRPFKRLIADSKQRNIDIQFMYHCWADTPQDVFRKGLDYIQLFKTEDSPEVRKKNLRLYDKVNAAYLEVKKAPSRFFGKYIDTSTQ